MAAKCRLDRLLVSRGYFPTRERARAAILAGEVLVDGAPVSKPGMSVPIDCRVEVKGDPVPYVSRGGLKLERALDAFEIEVLGRYALDAGASTGGFTDCLLQRGAARVLAVDVGYGQLAWSLRNDPRVVVMERTNLRYLTVEEVPFRPDLVTLDLAFISLTKVLPTVARLMLPGDLLALVKPQFEVGPEKVGRGGVVRDAAVHEEAVEKVVASARELGFELAGLDFSPIKGPKGNIEFWACFSWMRPARRVGAQAAREVVRRAWEALG